MSHTDPDLLEYIDERIGRPQSGADLGRLQVRLLVRAVRALEAIAENTKRRPPGRPRKKKPTPQD